MKALIDCDILVYQAAFGAEDRETGDVLSFDYVASLIDKAILEINDAVKGDGEPMLFVSGDTNFRDDVAVTKPYKGNRKKPKPFHYNNVRTYLMGLPGSVVVEGIEADDAMCIEQVRNPDKETVICTRDKDLRMCPGWHYGWEHGNQPEFAMQFVDKIGGIAYDAVKNKLTGTGLSFFYSQLITGDATDNIPGLPSKGPKAAWEALGECTTEEELITNTVQMYKDKMGDDWEMYMLEQGRLLWMIQELDANDNPVMWEIPT